MGDLVTTMTKKGQVTIPAEVRKLLGVKPKDKVSFHIEQGEVRLARAANTLEAAYGAVQPLKRPEDFEALVRAAKEERARRTVEKL
jgi:AbrB family looped-hinge helix DNA binding protein